MLGQREKSHQIYPRQLKIRVAEEVVSGLKGPAEASRDYGIHIRYSQTMGEEIS